MRDEDDRAPLALELVHRAVRAPGGNEPELSEPRWPIVDDAGQTVSGHRLHVDGTRDIGGGGQDRGGEWVLAVNLEGGGDLQDSLPVAASAATTSTTAGRLRVRVPVLSRATTRTPARLSRAAPPLTRAPILVEAPMAATTVTGTAMAKALGAAATSTTNARPTQS